VVVANLPQDKDQVMQKMFVDHDAKLKNEPSTAGFKIIGKCIHG
jgi:hypothetical protein